MPLPERVLFLDEEKVHSFQKDFLISGSFLAMTFYEAHNPDKK